MYRCCFRTGRVMPWRRRHEVGLAQMSMQYSRQFDHHLGQSSPAPENTSFSNRHSYSESWCTPGDSEGSGQQRQFCENWQAGPSYYTTSFDVTVTVNLRFVNPEKSLFHSHSDRSDLLYIEEL